MRACQGWAVRANRISRPSLSLAHTHSSCFTTIARPSRTKPKFIVDTLSHQPANLFSKLLNDILPGTTTTTAVSSSRSSSGDASTTSTRSLPQGAHLAYFPLLAPASKLAWDGADQDHVPEGFDLSEPGARRLWAGGEVKFRPGWRERMVILPPSSSLTRTQKSNSDEFLSSRSSSWVCREDIGDFTIRGGGSGEAGKPVSTTVDLWRRICENTAGEAITAESAEDNWLIREKRTLAFVTGWEEGKERFIRPPHKQPTASHEFTATPTHLFHFSALTYNAHFIHLDPTHGLLHGPLLLALMLRTLAHTVGSPWEIRDITYRNLKPVYVGSRARVCVRRSGDTKEGDEGENKEQKWDVWVEGPDGGLAVKAKALVAPVNPEQEQYQSESEWYGED